MKRAFDFTLALIGLVASIPLWLLIMLLIWLEDEHQVFYYQDRVGKDGKIFRSIQFRSMRVNVDDKLVSLQAKENDPRVTRVGSLLRVTAMDALPQLINIACGDMSFVGPRPLQPVEIDTTDALPRSIWEFVGAKERLSVKPGLTGVAQVFAPRDISRDIKFKYDIWYINNRSFLLDLYIICLSVVVTLRKRWELRQDKFSKVAYSLKKQIEKTFL